MNAATHPPPKPATAGAPVKRRVRYRGTHPRRFVDKYKELDPARYAADHARVIQRGDTPAGTHRPICVQEVLAVLEPQAGQTGLDATLGYGGHCRELLARVLPGGRVFGIDVDAVELARTEIRLRASGFGEEQLIVRQINFAGIPQLLPLIGGGLDFILADLGVSSMQLDNPARGFTFKSEGPLDLRLNPDRGQPARVLLQSIQLNKLTSVLRNHADEPHAIIIAQAICAQREASGSTTALAAVIHKALTTSDRGLPETEIVRSIRRTFQALRIAVNDEFSALDQFLRNLPLCLKDGGRAAVISFHSGEDKRVSKSFADGLAADTYSSICQIPIRASARECDDNPRAKSAVLRWARKRRDP
jgi:16S rRNA (cytosine1402-N4)-methyltransferase